MSHTAEAVVENARKENVKTHGSVNKVLTDLRHL